MIGKAEQLHEIYSAALRGRKLIRVQTVDQCIDLLLSGARLNQPGQRFNKNSERTCSNSGAEFRRSRIYTQFTESSGD